MPRTSSATLELPEDILVMLSFHFLFMRKPTPACPLLASEWYSRWPLWRVVKLSSFLRTSPSPITSHFMLFSFSSSSSSCTCSSFSNVLIKLPLFWPSSPPLSFHFYSYLPPSYRFVSVLGHFTGPCKCYVTLCSWKLDTPHPLVICDGMCLDIMTLLLTVTILGIETSHTWVQ